MKLSLLLATGALLALGTSASAQQRITGKVIPAPATACDPTATHMVENTSLLLKSSAVNLVPFENKNVDLDGIMTGPITCVVLDVLTAANAKYAHTATPANQYKIGTNVTFRGTGPFASLIGIIFTGGPGFLPLGTFGALLVDPSAYVLIGPTLAIFGTYSITVPIPNDPSLVGGPIQTQSFWATIVPAFDGYLVNTAAFTIKP